MPQANLRYYINERILVGQINGEYFRIEALSGGGAMSKKNITDTTVVNNIFKTEKQTTGHKTGEQRGGPIPEGIYEIGTPTSERLGYLHARLTPTTRTAAYLQRINRGGFLFHGSGPLGSDGCIVPTTSLDFQRLMKALTTSKGGTLEVILSKGIPQYFGKYIG